MRPISLLFAVPACLFLAACATRLCGTEGPGQPVHINVTYAADHTPRVEPETCRVRSGVEVTWRGPSADSTAFALEFPQGSPGTVTEGTPGRGYRSARSPVTVEAGEGSPRKVTIRVENKGNESIDHKYNVTANGHVLDPHIIIDR